MPKLTKGQLAYRRRNQRARTAGFSSYYDQRVRRGQLTNERPTGEALRTARGHAGRSGLLDYLQENDVVMLYRHVKDHERDAQGRWKVIEKIVHPDRPGRRERRFVLRNVSDRALRALIKAELERGAQMTLIPSLDQQKLLKA